MPRRSAVISAMTLNVEPGWRLPWAARLNFDVAYFCEDAMARMCPLFGSMLTSAADGSPGLARRLAIAVRASRCSLRSIVV